MSLDEAHERMASALKWAATCAEYLGQSMRGLESAWREMACVHAQAHAQEFAARESADVEVAKRAQKAFDAARRTAEGLEARVRRLEDRGAEES